MARPPGKNRFSTRTWIAEKLAEQNFEAIKEFVKLYRDQTTTNQERVKLHEMLWQYHFAKARPEDPEGNVEDAPQVTVITDEILRSLVSKAREGE